MDESVRLPPNVGELTGLVLISITVVPPEFNNEELRVSGQNAHAFAIDQWRVY